MYTMTAKEIVAKRYDIYSEIAHAFWTKGLVARARHLGCCR